MKSIVSVDLEGKLLIMNPNHLIREAQNKKFQVNFAQFGSGCDPDLAMSDKKIFVVDLSNGEKCEYPRSDFVGYIEEEQLSSEQKTILAKFKND